MSDQPKRVKGIKLEIHADETVAGGQYSNFIMVNQSETEFLLDFVFLAPQTNKAKVFSRVVLNPIHAKRLASLLNRQIEAYENRFGEIPLRKATKIMPPVDSDNTVN